MLKFFKFQDPLFALIVFSVVIAVAKFLIDGVTFEIAGHPVNLGHMDPLAYGSLLTPLLAAHGYIKGATISGSGGSTNVQSQ